jgi:dTDP-4-amino-4,6-dideoxygalactose transaminase
MSAMASIADSGGRLVGADHPTYIFFPIRIDDRRRVYDPLRTSSIVEQVHYVRVHRPTTHGGLMLFSVLKTEAAYARLLSLSIHDGLTDREQDQVVHSLELVL